MLKEQRLQYILGRLNKERIVTIAELSQSLDVSNMTIWRDLVELERRELLQRVRGGAVAPEIETLTTHATFANFDPNQDPHYDKKALIGRYAAHNLVNEGDNVTIEAGTTTSSMVPFLYQSNITILTNGLVTTLMAAPHIDSITVMSSGGILIDTGAFIGPQAEEFFNHFRVKKAFFSAQGITLEDGFTDPTPLYGQLKCAMKQNAEKTIMLIDSSKLGVRSLIQVMSLDEVDIVVSDFSAPIDIIEGLRQTGIEVHIAERDQTD